MVRKDHCGGIGHEALLPGTCRWFPTATRNHKHSTMSKPMRNVRQIREAFQPFPGAGSALGAA